MPIKIIMPLNLLITNHRNEWFGVFVRRSSSCPPEACLYRCYMILDSGMLRASLLTSFYIKIPVYATIALLSALASFLLRT